MNWPANIVKQSRFRAPRKKQTSAVISCVATCLYHQELWMSLTTAHSHISKRNIHLETRKCGNGNITFEVDRSSWLRMTQVSETVDLCALLYIIFKRDATMQEIKKHHLMLYPTSVKWSDFRAVFEKFACTEHTDQAQTYCYSLLGPICLFVCLFFSKM